VTQLSETPRDLDVLLRDHLTETVTLTQNGTRCTLTPPRALPAPRGDVRMRLVFTCSRPLAEAPADLKLGAFFTVSISHVHYARVTEPNGLREFVLTSGHTELAVGAAEAAPSSTFGSFLTLGFEHVLSGIDHIAFLIALAMLAGGPWRILIAVTGFTVGHSLTLALVALNVLRPDTAAVEALIGFTVAWAAGDALARARNLPRWYGLVGAAGILLLPVVAAISSLPVLSLAVIGGVALFAATMSYARNLDAPYVAPAIATIFGLAHGAGFAGPLLEMEIPSGSLVWTLLAFNLGVEAGQLTALALLAGILWLARRVVQPIPAVAYDTSASVLFALGTFWFVSRALS
jgi:hypothetical protein